MGYIRVITYLLTIDPNFQRDIQVVQWAQVQVVGPSSGISESR